MSNNIHITLPLFEGFRSVNFHARVCLPIPNHGRYIWVEDNGPKLCLEGELGA